MADIYPHDLAEATLAVLRRRARTAGLPLGGYLRQELIALARRRNSIDTVVEFLDEQGRATAPTVDTGALTLLQVYDLPSDVLAIWSRRALAAQLPMESYVHQELTASARRTTLEDSLTEIAEIQSRNPEVDVDLAAVAAAVRYARGM
ncbi:hypothetical protein ACFVMC_10710 [Nocardia sp. NPDC127579]|uniref:hypothetical protein n=1 Tax=Nocardia sp. NPDC127579 TaxID=3345402 RepID=UPI00363F59EE